MRLLENHELGTVSGGQFLEGDDGIDDSIGFVVAQVVNGSIVMSVDAINTGSLSGFADWDGDGAFTAGDTSIGANSFHTFSSAEIESRGFDIDGDGSISHEEGNAFADHLRGILTVPLS